MSERIKKYLVISGKIILTGIILYFIIQSRELKNALVLASSINVIYILASFVLYLVSKYITAERYRILLMHLDVNLSWSDNAKLYLVGMYYNLFLPGGISGDAYKAYYLNNKFNTGYKQLVALSIIDRIGGMVAITFLAIGLATFMFSPISSAIFIVLLIVLAISYWFVFKSFFSLYKESFLLTHFQSFLGQLVQMLMIYILLFVFDVNDLYAEYLLVFLISSVVSSLPLTIGGIGAREITFLYGAQYLGLDPTIALSVSLIFYLTTVAAGFLGFPYSLTSKTIIKV